jgi:hypothetical protein
MRGLILAAGGSGGGVLVGLGLGGWAGCGPLCEVCCGPLVFPVSSWQVLRRSVNPIIKHAAGQWHELSLAPVHLAACCVQA